MNFPTKEWCFRLFIEWLSIRQISTLFNSLSLAWKKSKIPAINLWIVCSNISVLLVDIIQQ